MCAKSVEVEICRVIGSRHISMQEVAARIDELPRDHQILVLCHHGSRSRQVTDFLRAQGFPAVSSVAGESPPGRNASTRRCAATESRQDSPFWMRLRIGADIIGKGRLQPPGDRISAHVEMLRVDRRDRHHISGRRGEKTFLHPSQVRRLQCRLGYFHTCRRPDLLESTAAE